MMSMTGFGCSEFVSGWRSFRVELRSFNNRFLDVKVRLPWPSAELERRVLLQLRQRLSRGRVELSVVEGPRSEHEGESLRLNGPLAQRVGDLLQELSQMTGCDLNTAAHLVTPPKDLLVNEDESTSVEAFWGPLSEAVKTALESLVQMRVQEGQALAQDLEKQLQVVEQTRTQVAQLAQDEPARHREKLLDRLNRLQLEGIEVDSTRVTEEVALYAERCDVNEELARLGSHRDQLRTMFNSEGQVGRKVEFMLQEMHRELNTIASKSLNAEIAQLVVEAKGAVEKMREQAQNAE